MVTVTTYGRHTGMYIYSEKMSVADAIAFTEEMSTQRGILLIWT